jgi:hypothetical protein
LYGVIIELIAPVVLIFPILDIPFAIAGLGLHYGIAYLQNIDFLPWWAPFYAVFFLGDSNLLAEVPGTSLPAAAKAYAELYPIGFALTLGYAAVHIAGMIIHRFIPDIDMLPLSRFPMFDSPKNLWDPARSHWAWLTEKTHAPGQLMTFAFPMCRPQCVQPSEMDSLPFKYFLFGRKTAEDAELTVYTNVIITDDLQWVLKRFAEEWSKGADKYKDPATTAGMLELVDAAKAAFARAPRRKPQQTMGAAVSPPPLNKTQGLWKQLLPETMPSATKGSKLEPLLGSGSTAESVSSTAESSQAIDDKAEYLRTIDFQQKKIAQLEAQLLLAQKQAMPMGVRSQPWQGVPPQVSQRFVVSNSVPRVQYTLPTSQMPTSFSSRTPRTGTGVKVSPQTYQLVSDEGMGA